MVLFCKKKKKNPEKIKNFVDMVFCLVLIHALKQKPKKKKKRVENVQNHEFQSQKG